MLPSNEKLRTEIFLAFSNWQLKFNSFLNKISRIKDLRNVKKVKNTFLNEVEIPAWERIRKTIQGYMEKDLFNIIKEIDQISKIFFPDAEMLELPSCKKTRKETFKNFNEWEKEFSKLIIEITSLKKKSEMKSLKNKFMARVEVPTWDKLKDELIRFYIKEFLKIESRIVDIAQEIKNHEINNEDSF
ncbi:MAG: hypothetical protein ACTSVI_06795 [Promethearchaeota archaeon]